VFYRTWHIVGMPKPLTVEELLPLVQSLSPQDKVRLLRLMTTTRSDAEAYRDQPPGESEFSTAEDPMAWDADGWENIE